MRLTGTPLSLRVRTALPARAATRYWRGGYLMGIERFEWHVAGYGMTRIPRAQGVTGPTLWHVRAPSHHTMIAPGGHRTRTPVTWVTVSGPSAALPHIRDRS